MKRGSVQHINPDGLPKSPAFSNVIVVTGPAKTIYVGGQDAVDASGNIVHRAADRTVPCEHPDGARGRRR